MTDEIEIQLEILPRRDIAAKTLENSKIIIVHDTDEAIKLSNVYAPEHLIINTVDYEQLAEHVVNAVADPGASVVEMAQKRGLKVVPLVGPSSMILAVMASGFNGQSFSFNGYLPAKPAERSTKLRQLETRAWKEDQTQLFIEAPYRNLKMLETILKTCRKDTRLCIASGITTDCEFIRTMTVDHWKKNPAPDINKVPAIFLIYRG